MVLVVGCGSIGERHIRTFLQTGRCRIIACDTSTQRLKAIAARYPILTAGSLEEARRSQEVHFSVIATPADSHVRLATECLRHGSHCLIEKPLALNLRGIEELLEARACSGRTISVAYVQRFRPAFAAAAQFIRQDKLGRILQAVAISGQDFASLRPAYQRIYYRDHATGGGAIQDALTHLVNCVEWLVGPTQSVYCVADHLVLPGVAVEDTVAAIARNGSTIVSYSLNQFQAPNETTLQFNAERGSIRIDFATNRWGLLMKGASEWMWKHSPIPEIDSLFVAQAHAFLDQCQGKDTDLATLEDGIQAVTFHMAAFQSLEKNCSVPVHTLSTLTTKPASAMA